MKPKLLNIRINFRSIMSFNGWDVAWAIIRNVKPWPIKTKAWVSHWVKKRVWKNRSLGASGLFQWRINELMLEHFRYGRRSEKWKKKGSENFKLFFMVCRFYHQKSHFKLTLCSYVRVICIKLINFRRKLVILVG